MIRLLNCYYIRVSRNATLISSNSEVKTNETPVSYSRDSEQVNLRSSLFQVLKHLMLVAVYRRFGTDYRSIFKSKVCYVMTQNSEGHNYTMAAARNVASQPDKFQMKYSIAGKVLSNLG
jgi:hypothetical protein